MSLPKLQVLILTDPGRRNFLNQILTELGNQIGTHPAEILIHAYEPSVTLGENRNRQVRESASEYICFVDDDDFIAPDYFDRIVPLLDRDYIGFRVQCYAAHKGYEKACEMQRWGPPSPNFYSGMSHLNPIRRELALQAAFDYGQGEDFRWSMRLWKLGVIKSERIIDDVMYHYLWRAAKDDARDPVNPKRLALIDSIRGSHERNSCGALEIP